MNERQNNIQLSVTSFKVFFFFFFLILAMSSGFSSICLFAFLSFISCSTTIASSLLTSSSFVLSVNFIFFFGGEMVRFSEDAAGCLFFLFFSDLPFIVGFHCVRHVTLQVVSTLPMHVTLLSLSVFSLHILIK